ncbi:AAA family ATPase, partial [Haemophilus haemolyticus]|uniref:AAA family ATPase n=2 Tax=Bacteria TaxID=2 RepID=UPI0015E39328
MLKSDFNSDLINKENLLTSSLIFGANASGKSNFIDSLALLKKIVLRSTDELSKNYLEDIVPFLFNKIDNSPSTFEISIFSQEVYTYSISFLNRKIVSEELCIYSENNLKKNETLFIRNDNIINNVSERFSESYSYFNQETKEINNSDNVKNIPFISIIAGVGGVHSKNVINWFNKLHIISGLLDDALLNFSLNLFEKDLKFYDWASQFLPSLQIDKIDFEDNVLSLFEKIDPKELKTVLAKVKQKKKGKHTEVIEKFIDLVQATTEIEDKKINAKKVNVIKNINGEKYELPFRLESEGTRKLIALLGPIYDSIQKKHVLVCDEIDSKFHTLLMKYILKIFNKDNKECQLIASAQDTNLIDKDIFNEDQIWFVNKNEFGESGMYSLIEFKNLTNTDYASSYLKGAYNAIPLFENKDI